MEEEAPGEQRLETAAPHTQRREREEREERGEGREERERNGNELWSHNKSGSFKRQKEGTKWPLNVNIKYKKLQKPITKENVMR